MLYTCDLFSFNMPKHKQAHSNYVKGIENPNLNSSEIKNICQKLKLGNVMINFSISKKKPEQRTFYVSIGKFYQLQFITVIAV